MSSGGTERRGPGKWIPLLMAVVFLGPLSLATYLYYGTDGWRPATGRHHGALIDPARPLPSFPAATAGEEAAAGLFQGKWTLLYFGHGDCSSRCSEALHDMRQIRLALGKDGNRLQRILLYRTSALAMDAVKQEYAELIVAEVDLQRDVQFLNAFRVNREQELFTAGRIYIIDPLGNLVLSYAQDANPSGLLEDVKRLLKLSRIG